MSKTGNKLLITLITLSVAVAPLLAQAYTVGTDGGSGQETYSNSSSGIGSGNTNTSGGIGDSYGSANDGGGLSTSSAGYKGTPGSSKSGSSGNANTSTGVGSHGSTGNANTSTGISSGSNGTSGSDDGTGVSTSDPGYKGVPGSSKTGNNGNTSTGVSTGSSDYKDVPGSSGGNNGNTSTGVSTGSGYNGVPGREPSLCNGHYYPRDIDGHWAEIYIRRLYDLCIVEGYSDGTFRPDTYITRAELVKMSLYSKGIAPNPGCYDADCGSPFMDLDMWQGPWIRPAWDRGIIQGYTRDRFRPDQDVTRAEAVKVILATYGYGPLSTSKSFFNDVHGWSVGWVEKAHEIGLVQGIGNGDFDPDRPITRAEAAKIIAKMMEYWDTHIS